MNHYDIAILLGYPEISGGTNVIFEHALGLARLGHRVHIVTEQPFESRRLAWKPAALELPRLSHADCAAREFDLALATWWRSVFDLPFVAARRYAYFCQSIESRFFGDRDAECRVLADYTYRQPLPVVTEAHWIAEHLRTRYGRQATVVRNGIDKALFTPDGPSLEPRPQAGLRVLVEGPLRVPFKRVEMTLDLCRRAADDVWLLTSSPCPPLRGVRRVLAQIPLSEVPAVHRSCDVLVKLSTVEGMFGPPLEMMHCGGTAITTDVTGHEEFMRDGENGLVVPIGQEERVVEHLRRLRSDRAWLERLKAGAARTAAAWHAWPAAVREMDAFVRRVVEEPVGADVVHYQMRTQLRAALELAGPLHRVMTDDESGWDLLRRLGRRVGRRLAHPWRTVRSLLARRRRAAQSDRAAKRTDAPHRGSR